MYVHFWFIIYYFFNILFYTVSCSLCLPDNYRFDGYSGSCTMCGVHLHSLNVIGRLSSITVSFLDHRRLVCFPLDGFSTIFWHLLLYGLIKPPWNVCSRAMAFLGMMATRVIQNYFKLIKINIFRLASSIRRKSKCINFSFIHTVLSYLCIIGIKLCILMTQWNAFKGFKTFEMFM